MIKNITVKIFSYCEKKNHTNNPGRGFKEINQKMSPAAEKFCLRWNDFENKFSSAFQELRENKDFFDVTLACDGQQIEAHKVILIGLKKLLRFKFVQGRFVN